jgi:hypothetical protein
MATRITGVMAGNTTADHDFLALDDFNIVPILLCVKRPSDWLQPVNSSETIPYGFLGSST